MPELGPYLDTLAILSSPSNQENCAAIILFVDLCSCASCCAMELARDVDVIDITVSPCLCGFQNAPIWKNVTVVILLSLMEYEARTLAAVLHP